MALEVFQLVFSDLLEMKNDKKMIKDQNKKNSTQIKTRLNETKTKLKR